MEDYEKLIICIIYFGTDDIITNSGDIVLPDV